jgi:rod shape-determining protein MreC
MRNLFAFLKRFQIFLVFAALQITALSFYFTYFYFPRSQYLTTASNINGKIFTIRNDITKQLNLSKTNKALHANNLRLMKKIPQSFIQIEKTVFKINDTIYHQQYEYIAGTVINSTIDKTNNYFTVNIGSTQGIKPGMGVFSDNGIVGVIHNTSEHFSVIKTVLTENINVDVIIQPIGLFGLLKWDHRDARYGTVAGISNDLKIKKWSKVYTKGGSGIYPRGILVGRVAELIAVEGEAFWDVRVKFSENYQSLQKVYVVRNLLLEEQKKIESSIPKEK